MMKNNLSKNRPNALDVLKTIIGRCGLYCAACDIYRVYVDKNKEKQRKMAEFFKRKPEQIRCQGCQNLTPDDWCSGCKIILCLDEKKYNYCYECKDIESCDIFQELNKRYNNMPYKNLKRLKEFGEKKWLEEQITRWHCSKCGEPIEYGAKTCTSCGFDLTSIED